MFWRCLQSLKHYFKQKQQLKLSCCFCLKYGEVSATMYISMYFHLKDIGDGDFYGIDKGGDLFKITHDPFYISLISRDSLLKMFEE